MQECSIHEERSHTRGGINKNDHEVDGTVCILYIHQPIHDKEIHMNSLDTKNMLVPT